MRRRGQGEWRGWHIPYHWVEQRHLGGVVATDIIVIITQLSQYKNKTGESRDRSYRFIFIFGKDIVNITGPPSEQCSMVNIISVCNQSDLQYFCLDTKLTYHCNIPRTGFGSDNSTPKLLKVRRWSQLKPFWQLRDQRLNLLISYNRGIKAILSAITLHNWTFVQVNPLFLIN